MTIDYNDQSLQQPCLRSTCRLSLALEGMIYDPDHSIRSWEDRKQEQTEERKSDRLRTKRRMGKSRTIRQIIWFPWFKVCSDDVVMLIISFMITYTLFSLLSSMLWTCYTVPVIVKAPKPMQLLQHYSICWTVSTYVLKSPFLEERYRSGMIDIIWYRNKIH